MEHRRFYPRYGKRCFDLGCALAGLVVLAPLLALIAVAVVVASGWPPIYSQERVGRYGRLFRVRKFRTMANRPGERNTITIDGDRRITRIGRLLRRAKLDELPQLWNVLVGDMSLVGPRPDVPGYADRLVGDDRAILTVRPGITGPASLAFRDEERILAAQPDPVRYNDEVIYPEKVRLNRRYTEEMGLLTDLRYILKTIVGT